MAVNWWDTPEIEAAKKKALAGGAGGVFTLDQLKALGQTGDMATDWMAGAKKDPLLAGGGRAIVNPDLKLPAGYYQIPGAAGAYYYNPSSGQVSQEFADWANSGKIERDPITNLPKALMDQRDGGEAFRASDSQNPATLETLRKIFEYGKVNGSYQEAQDKVLGLGQYQQFMTSKDGKQLRVSDALGQAPVDPATAPFTQTPTPTGGFDRLMKLTGKTRDEVSKMLGGSVTANESAIAASPYYEGTSDTRSSLEDALASNYEKRATMWKGLQDQRAARGVDINTGTSEAEKKRIYDTVSRISDPAQRAAYLSAQDPGNLTTELRAERYALRAGERDQIAAYEKAHPEVRYDFNETNKYGDTKGRGIQVKITSGSQVMTDPATGREIFVGSVPKKIELVKARVKNIDRAAAAAQGVAVGGMSAMLTGGSSLFIGGSALLGGMSGMGFGPNVKNISMKRRGTLTGFGQWDVRDPHMMNMREVGTAFAFAALFGGFGKGAGAKTAGSSYSQKAAVSSFGPSAAGLGAKNSGFMLAGSRGAVGGGAFMMTR